MDKVLSQIDYVHLGFFKQVKYYIFLGKRSLICCLLQCELDTTSVEELDTQSVVPSVEEIDAQSVVT